MQTMIDALYPDSILLDNVSRNADIVAAYIDHNRNPNSFAQAVARFPNKKHVKISVRGNTDADILDCEASTGVTPASCVPWAQGVRRKGREPTVYCNELSTAWGWPNVKAAFNAAGVAHPMYWVANYSRPPGIPAGAHGHQYGDLDANGHNSYDVSIMLDSWLQEENMDLTPQNLSDIAKAVWSRTSPGVEEDSKLVQSYGDWLVRTNYRVNHDVQDVVRSARAAILAAIAKIPGADVNEAALAQALVPLLVPALAAQLPQIPQSELEAALTNVLGSLND